MAVSVSNAGLLNTPSVNASAARSLSQSTSADDSGGADFTKHLDQAKDAAAEKAQPASPPLATKQAKPTKSAAKKSDSTDDDEDSADKATAEKSSDGPAPVPAVNEGAADDSEKQKTPEEKTAKPAVARQPALTAEQTAAAQAAGVQPGAAPVVAAGKTVVKTPKPGATNDPIKIVDAKAAQPTTAAPVAGPAPTAEAIAKAQKTAAAFEAKSGKVATTNSDPAETTDPVVAPHSQAHGNAQVASQTLPDVAAAQAAVASDAAAISIDATKSLGDADTDSTNNAAAVNQIPAQPASARAAAPAAPAPAPAATPEARFAEANHATIINSVKTNLLPRGGSMQLRLDPPELGRIQVNVEMRDGVMNATFQTTSDDATRMLSHSLGQLKSSLESQGVTVEKIQVQQTPHNQSAQGGDDQSGSQQQQQRDQADAQQEQQRKEMLKRMWRRVSGVQEPVNLVA